MKDNDLRNLSADDEYVRLLAAAYPGPKRDLRSAVMAQIAAEDSKILKNKKKSRWSAEGRNRFVRYGSLAACLVLLTVLGFRVLPMMNDIVAPVTETESAMDAAAWTDETAPAEAPMAFADTVTEEGISPYYFKSHNFGGDPIDEEVEPEVGEEAVAEEYDGAVAVDEPAEAPVEEAVVEAAPLAPVEEEAPVEEVAENAIVTEVQTYSAVEELNLPPAGEIIVAESAIQEIVEEEVLEDGVTMEEQGLLHSYTYTTGAGTTSVSSGSATVPKSLSYTSERCLHGEVFGNSFHDIPKSVMTLVKACAAEADVAAWCDENAGSCNMNIYELLVAFDVPRDAFEELYTTTDLWYHHDYNADLLYGGDRAAVYEYYRNGGDARFANRYFMYELKLALYTEVGASAYNAWAGERGYTTFVRWSLAEFVRDFAVSRERFAEVYDDVVARFTENHPADLVPGYDPEKLYTADADTDVPGYIADAAYMDNLA